MLQKFSVYGIKNLCLFAALFFLFIGFAGATSQMDLNHLVLQDLDYTDAMETLPNYDRGFYRPQILHIKPSGTAPIKTPYGKLLHLRAEISEFSSRARLAIKGTDTTWGKSQDLTDDALNVLQTSFDNIRNYGGKVIVRICYDPWYNGQKNIVPEHKWVLRHVEQLAPVLNKNTDVILALEMGMHGAYGEMHSDTSITYARVSEAVNLMLKRTSPDLKILTRTGNYSAAVLGFEKWGVDFYIDGPKFKEIAKAKGDTMYRVGMFNDGYLGTQYDYGTWGADCATSICREEGVAWLEKYSINMPYGGEALTTANGYKVINTPEYLSYEGFRTHTSYLNIEWNYNLINSWKESMFKGKDYEYDESVTGFKYIDDHLGYRYVLRESKLIDTVDATGKFRASLKIQNVGFGNLTQKIPVKLLLQKVIAEEGECPIIDTIALNGIDFRDVHSRKIEVNGSDTTVSFNGINEVNVETVVSGKGWYNVVLNVGNISFANTSFSFACEDSKEGLYIGKVYIDPNKKPKEEISESIKFQSKDVRKQDVRVERYGKLIQIRIGEKLFLVNGSKIQ